jgi:hypothetical protein
VCCHKEERTTQKVIITYPLVFYISLPHFHLEIMEIHQFEKEAVKKKREAWQVIHLGHLT